MKYKVSFITILIFVSAGLLIAQMFLANRLSEDGQLLYSLQKQTADLQDKNNQLKSQTFKEASLNTISQKAQSLGFVANPKVISLNRKLDIALSR